MSTTIHKTDEKPISFFSLAREMRNKIYHLLVEADKEKQWPLAAKTKVFAQFACEYPEKVLAISKQFKEEFNTELHATQTVSVIMRVSWPGEGEFNDSDLLMAYFFKRLRMCDVNNKERSPSVSGDGLDVDQIRRLRVTLVCADVQSLRAARKFAGALLARVQKDLPNVRSLTVNFDTKMAVWVEAVEGNWLTAKELFAHPFAGVKTISPPEAKAVCAIEYKTGLFITSKAQVWYSPWDVLRSVIDNPKIPEFFIYSATQAPQEPSYYGLDFETVYAQPIREMEAYVYLRHLWGEE